MGQAWTLSLDVSAAPFLLGGVLVVRNPTQITLENGSVLLGLPPDLLGLQYQLGPTAQWSVEVPFDASLCGFGFVVQGVHYLTPLGAGDYQLANAYDCVIGT